MTVHVIILADPGIDWEYSEILYGVTDFIGVSIFLKDFP